MGISRRTSGVLVMVAGAITQVVGFMFIALLVEPFPIALNLIGGGFLLFFIGAALHSRRLDTSYQAPRRREWSQDL